jgi:hypothetical protein
VGGPLLYSRSLRDQRDDMTTTPFRPRLGTSTGSDTLEDGIVRAARAGAGVVELACQHPRNRPDGISADRAAVIRDLLAAHRLIPIVHTDSSVNTAERTDQCECADPADAFCPPGSDDGPDDRAVVRAVLSSARLSSRCRPP